MRDNTRHIPVGGNTFSKKKKNLKMYFHQQECVVNCMRVY